ncbi:cytochrome P450 [Stachybotrys elegans]|uniref:Cytochrome P450 n=1 Tax=Stachybotrys elegans TaxID=80388 RepID=A0A8K0WPC6_9HYPO|nr:cytochrome P450 [Stachybotrys elegans]
MQEHYSHLVVALVLVTIVLTASPLLPRLSPPKGAPSSLPSFRGVNSPKFYRDRATFLNQGSKQTANGQFSFWYGPNHVVALSGSSARAGYLTTRGLDSVSGFQILFGNFLNIEGLTSALTRATKLVYKRCTQDEQLVLNLHHLVNDTEESLKQLGSSAVIDPVNHIGVLVYRLTHRLNGTHDIANDLDLVHKTREMYKPLGESSMFDIWFPLLPTPAKAKKVLAYSRLYWLMQGFVSDRQKTGRKENDALQLMMEQGLSMPMTALGIIGAVLPAILNSTISASWNLCFIVQNPKWMQKLKEEINNVIKSHRLASDMNNIDTLRRLTLHDWEHSFPLLMMALKETIRFVMAGTLVRKNITGKHIPIGDSGSFIPPNSLAVYASADIHMNPEVYPEPHIWDPDRHAESNVKRQDVPHPYVGWGSGNHPCPAQRVAKLTIIVPTVALLASFDMSMCDASGRPSHDPLPPLVFDCVGGASASKTVYIKCNSSTEAEQ